MEVIPSGKVMDTRLVQFSKAFVPMDVSPSPKTMEVRLVHRQNARSPIKDRFSGKVMDCSRLQSWKAQFPIKDRLLGTAMDRRDLHLVKAHRSMQVTPSGKIIHLKWLSPENECVPILRTPSGKTRAMHALSIDIMARVP